MGLGGRLWRWFRAPPRGTAARSNVAVVCIIGLSAIVVGCSSRPYGTLVVGPTAPDASQVDLLVATTRAPVLEPPGVMFGGRRGRGLDFADIVVSIPPAGARRRETSPSRPRSRAIPQRDFVILRADRIDLAQAKANFDARVARTPGRRVLVFVHGYNTRFEEAVYRSPRLFTTRTSTVAPILFTWPSGGNVTTMSMIATAPCIRATRLEAVLQALVKDPNVDSISILAHSMGNYLAVESLRQMSIRDHGLSPKIRDVMLASPRHRRRRLPPPNRRNRCRATTTSSPCSFRETIARLAYRAFSRAIRRASARSIPPRSPTVRSSRRQGASHRPNRHRVQRLHQSQQVRHQRSRWRDR